jgi:hypothetical protein
MPSLSNYRSPEPVTFEDGCYQHQTLTWGKMPFSRDTVVPGLTRVNMSDDQRILRGLLMDLRLAERLGRLCEQHVKQARNLNARTRIPIS